MSSTPHTSESPPATERSARARRRGSAPLLERYGLIVAWAVVVLLFSLLKPDVFPTAANFQTIFGSQAVLLVLALGLLFPLTAGDFDLSIASMMSLSAMLVAILNVQEGWPIGLAILAALAAGLLVGVINGGLIVLIGIDSFIVTLGSGSFLLGLVQWISSSNTITGIAPVLSDATIGTRFLGVSLGFWYAAAATLAIWYVYQYVPLGRRLLFVGRNRSVARLSGLRVGRLRWGALIASALMASLAGILYAGTLGGADPSSGQALLLPAFAAVFLGATAIQPGRFNPIGTFIAVYFLVSGITGLQLLGVESFVQQLFYGGALVLAVALSTIAARRRGRSGQATPGAM
jgi:ribose transport system permease protein